MRKICIVLTGTGESVLADMLDDDAPRICQAIWDRLPLDANVIHGMYSGPEVFMMLDNPEPLPPENLTHLPLPGEILYFYDSGANAASSRKPSAEICIAYSRGAVLRAHEGIPTSASLFARIPGDWKHDWKGFAEGCRRVRWHGPQRLRVERVDP